MLVPRMHPRALIADVGHFEQRGVQSSRADTILKEGGMCVGCTGGDDDPVQALFLDRLCDVSNSILRARI